MTGFIVLFGIDAGTKDMFYYLCSAASYLSSPCQHIGFGPSFYIHRILMVGRHVLSDGGICPGNATACMQCDTVMIIINLNRFIIIQYVYPFACVRIGNTVIAMIFGELDMIVALYGRLYRFFWSKRFCRKCFQKSHFILIKELSAAILRTLITFI